VLNLPQKQEDAFRVSQALFAFGNYAETRPVVEWLQHELARIDRANRREADETALKHAQGAAQAIEDILTHIEQSRERADKIRDAIIRKGANQ